MTNDADAAPGCAEQCLSGFDQPRLHASRVPRRVLGCRPTNGAENLRHPPSAPLRGAQRPGVTMGGESRRPAEKPL